MSGPPRIPVETDPIGAIRTELVAAARRRRTTRLRRRRLATVAATIVATLACAAGAVALTDIGTGIPAIDELLGNYERNEDRSSSHAHGRQSSFLDAVPKIGSTAVSVEVPWGEGPQQAVGSLYLSEGNGLCFALAQPVEPSGGVVRGSKGDCRPPRIVSDRLARERVFISGMSFGETMVVHGYASVGVDIIGVTGPTGRLDVRVSRPWRPQVRGADSLRLFMAWGPAAPTGPRRETVDIGDPRKYTVRARLQDGRVIQRSPLGGDVP